MNESEFLIYHYSSKNEQWYDATKNVACFSEDNNAWSVKFKSSDDFYHVSYQKMRIFDNPKEVEFAELYADGYHAVRRHHGGHAEHPGL